MTKPEQTSNHLGNVKITAATAIDAKRVIIADLQIRANLMRESANTKGHDKDGRNALLVAVRVLEVAIANITDNLACI